MSSPSRPAVAGQGSGEDRTSAESGASAEASTPDPAGAASARERGETGAGYDPGPLWMRLLPPVATFAIMMLGITVPSYWRDEAATMSAVHRPFGQLLRMLHNVDAVHAAYYFFMWVDIRVFGSSELAMRWPSAVAMAIAALFVAASGRRLVSPGAGLAAGLLFAVVPNISFYGQDARSYAMVTAAAVVASYLLLRALGAPEGRQRRWWAGYGAALALVGVLNYFGLLLVLAHAVTMLLVLLRPAALTTQARRQLVVRWLSCAVVAGIIGLPFALASFKQKAQLSWLTAPGRAGVESAAKLLGPDWMSLAALVALIAGLVVTLVRLRGRLPQWLFSMPALALPWMIVPPAILLLGSVVHPVYNFRYILFCVPAAALLVGAAIAALGWIAGPAALIVVALLGTNAQFLYRAPGGHADDIRQADRLIQVNSKPGDVVLYTNTNAESFGAAYPYGLARLRNIQQARPPIPSATLGGTNVSAAVLHSRLAHVKRVWIVEIDKSAPAHPYIKGLHYHLLWIWRTSDIWLRLYQREPHKH